MTHVIRLTPNQFAQIIGDLEVIEADLLTAGPIRDRARAIRETLWQEAEHPLQQACERAEAMGEEPF